ncbi:alpha/beta fold hydrolase [Deminuibacter soli]|uniref:Alpha/beta hydrolase n=1 Tax=Deminuibacter soli TaxID=2291815 RepID=A0A3E1NH98_9BACT|nr:alpha/beta hydrolase [Deminuibacter soli]RFM27231.1 alpha/beta hydrolase [Deminuibacter soli]
MPVIKLTSNTTLHYQEMNRGAAETIVLIHGMMSNLSVFYFNIAPMLAQRYHVVLYDLKGHGLSSKCTWGYHLQGMAADLIQLLDALHLRQVHVAGYSYGALIALQTAVSYPERIQQLVAIEAPDPFEQQTLARIDAYSKSALLEQIAAAGKAQGKPMSKRQLERNYNLYHFLLKQTTLQQDMLAEKDFMQQPGIDRLLHNTLLLYGTDSPCASTGKQLLRKIPNAQLAWLAGDHHIPVQQPFQVGSSINSFLQPRENRIHHFQPSATSIGVETPGWNLAM